jgi:hypothetical protein
VRDAVELIVDRLIDRRVAVAVDVAPQRRDAVDVGIAVGVVEIGSLGSIDDERRGLVAPAALLGERVQRWSRSAWISSSMEGMAAP